MSNSSWYNLAGIVDGSTAKLHVNGTQECSVNIGGGFLTPASDLVLGATSTGLNAWSGSMGEVRIYGTSNGSAVGTAADITTNLTATKIRYPLNDINFVSTYGIVFQADAAHGLGLNTPMTSGVCPGNWVDLSPTGVVGTPLNFASCSPTSGAQGSGTTADPYRVVFDGINDTIDFGSNSAFDRLTGDFTIEQWIKSANVGNYQTPFSLDDAATGNGILFYTAVTSGYTRTWIGGVGYNGGTTIVDGNWHQAIIMRKAGIAYHYIDGTQTGTITSAGSALTGQRLRLGTYNGASGYPYNGSIARTVFYNRALSPTERTQNCAAIASRFTGVTCH